MRGLAIGVATLLGAIGLFTMYHRFKLRAEKGRIVPNGKLVEVNGNQIHVYTEGDNEEAPVLLFLGGSVVTAPVYDFKPVWSILSKEYRIAVVERLGYGYSDLTVTPRDIETILDETRTALSLADVTGPYVLCAHSLAGLEAFRFVQTSKEEVAGIVGIDMLLPKIYLEIGEELMSEIENVRGARRLFWMGMHRLPLPGENFQISTLALTEKEQEQVKLLTLRNFFNDVIFKEIDYLLENSRVVDEGGAVDVPIKLLVANTQATPELAVDWKRMQKDFAEEHNVPIKFFDAGHFIHQFKPEEVASEIREFVKGLENNEFSSD